MGSPSEVTKEMAQQQLDVARTATCRVRDYWNKGVYSLELLQRRRDICGTVYHSTPRMPRVGPGRVEFILALLKARQRFFDELVENGILDRMNR